MLDSKVGESKRAGARNERRTRSPRRLDFLFRGGGGLSFLSPFIDEKKPRELFFESCVSSFFFQKKESLAILFFFSFSSGVFFEPEPKKKETRESARMPPSRRIRTCLGALVIAVACVVGFTTISNLINGRELADLERRCRGLEESGYATSSSSSSYRRRPNGFDYEQSHDYYDAEADATTPGGEADGTGFFSSTLWRRRFVFLDSVAPLVPVPTCPVQEKKTPECIRELPPTGNPLDAAAKNSTEAPSRSPTPSTSGTPTPSPTASRSMSGSPEPLASVWVPHHGSIRFDPPDRRLCVRLTVGTSRGDVGLSTGSRAMEEEEEGGAGAGTTGGHPARRYAVADLVAVAPSPSPSVPAERLFSIEVSRSARNPSRYEGCLSDVYTSELVRRVPWLRLSVEDGWRDGYEIRVSFHRMIRTRVPGAEDGGPSKDHDPVFRAVFL